MPFDKSKFTEIRYKNDKFGEHSLFFDFDISECNHVKRNKTFKFHETLLKFLNENPEKHIYITKAPLSGTFEESEENIYIINLEEFQSFCKKLNKREDRASAFFRKGVCIDNIKPSEEQKANIFANATEQEILNRIRSFTTEEKQNFLRELNNTIKTATTEDNVKDITTEEFLSTLFELMKDPIKQKSIIETIPKIQIKALELYKTVLENNLDQDEKFIQNWIDAKIDENGNQLNILEEESAKIRKSRCLIFGLEFIDHKREGSNSSKRFDVLTRLSEGENEYVLIELKSPNAEVFSIKEKVNANGGTSTEYSLSDDLSRAIPQILRYRGNLESKSEEDEDLQRIGIKKGKIPKCIILIGQRKINNPLWENHFSSLKENFGNSLELWTYTDLIRKLGTTIKNLTDNLNCN